MRDKGLLIGIGTALALGAVGLGVYFGLLKKDKKSNDDDDEIPDSFLVGSSGSSGGGSNSSKGDSNYGSGSPTKNEISTQEHQEHDLVAENLSKEIGIDKYKFYFTNPDGSKASFVTFENYRANFFNNGRIYVFRKDSGKVIYKGNYSNGGKKITITEGLNKGKTFTNSSLLVNLRNTLKI